MLINITNRSFFIRSASEGPAIRLRGLIELSDIVSDYNTFYQNPADPVVWWQDPPAGIPELMTLAEWRLLGKDLYSQILDPSTEAVSETIQSILEGNAKAKPPLVAAPCCARFWQTTNTSSPAVYPPVFSNHLPSGTATSGWSDPISYEDLDIITATFCGPCNRDGLLATYPTSYP